MRSFATRIDKHLDLRTIILMTGLNDGLGSMCSSLVSVEERDLSTASSRISRRTKHGLV